MGKLFTGLVDMTSSERGIYALGVLVCATLLCILGYMSSVEWAGVAVGSQGIHAWAKTVRPSSEPSKTATAAAHPAPAPAAAPGEGK